MTSRQELWRQKRERELVRKEQESNEHKRKLAEYLRSKTEAQSVIARESSQTLKKWVKLREQSDQY